MTRRELGLVCYSTRTLMRLYVSLCPLHGGVRFLCHGASYSACAQPLGVVKVVGLIVGWLHYSTRLH